MQATVMTTEPARLRAPADPPIETWTDFLRLCADMVSDHAPYLFAVVQEQGEREDGWIAGWGLAFGGHVDVVAADGGRWARVGTPAEAERLFDRADDVTGLLVWCDNDGA